MNTRELRESDVPILRAIYERQGLAHLFPDLHGPLMELVDVVVNEDGQPVAACAAERMLEAYLIVDESLHPAAKLRTIKMLHESMATRLREIGYHQINCAVPAKMEKSFGRRLMRTFQWVPNLTSFARHF